MQSVDGDLRSFLRESGASDDEIDRAASEGWLPLLTVDRLLLPGEPVYDAAGLAGAAGVPADFARRIWRALGFPDVPAGLPVFTDRDAGALREAAKRIGLSGDVDAFLRGTRAISAAMATVGAIDAEVIAEAISAQRAAGSSDEQIAAALVGALDWPGFAVLIDHVHRIQARAAVWRRLTLDAIADVGIAIGFADLAGYTTLSAELEPDQLSALLARWEDIAYNCTAEHAGRVVKTIGDEVMFAGLAESVLGTGLEILDAASADPLVPPVRVGLASGSVIARDGDFYGPVVNLASRLTEIAGRETVLASASLHDQFAHDPLLEWESIGWRHLRGVGDVDVYAVTRRRSVA